MMKIETPEVKKILDDYDILFDSGFMMPLTVDLSKGDTISFDDKAILVHLTPKPSQADPKKFLPAEDLTIFTPHIISIQHRVREFIEPSPEESLRWEKTWKDLTVSPTIQ